MMTFCNRMLLAASLVTLAGTAAQAAQLSGDEFVATHAGKCFTYTGPSSGKECYNTDGTATYDDASYGKNNGSWSIRGNQVCTRYRGEGLSCGPITRVNGNTYTDGEYTWTIK